MEARRKLSSQTSSNILEVKGLRKSFGGLHAIDDVNIEIKRGSITGLIGPNGSGKSTLFNVIGGTIPRDSGSITFDGTKIDKLPPYKIFKLGLGRTFQTPRLFFGMTVLENSLIPPKDQKGENPLVAPFYKSWEKQELELAKKSRDTLNFLEIEKLYDKWSSEISGGQMKLLQLAAALMGEPKMLMLDEPAAGVAPRLAQDIFKSIEKQRQEKGTTFLIIEHRLEILFNYVDYVFVMGRGKLLSRGKPDEVVKDQIVIDAYLG
ncbi:MAG: ABC transporter ATP-binding protein [Nitrososphaerales archaeon]